MTTGVYAPKGKPPPIPGVSSLRAKATVAADDQYFYAQGGQSATTGGAFGSYEVAKPTLAAGDSHTLAELAVSSSDTMNIVEVGWTVDRSLNGDLEPHLFVFYWANGKASCYNVCGFVPAPSGGGGGGPVGRKLTVGSSLFLSIRHSPGAWWVSADGIDWFGYFPDSLWGGKFTQAGGQQWFGEVASPNAAPCSDMGKGVFASSTSAAPISGMGLWDSSATTNVGVASTHPNLYTVVRASATQLRYGGPGAC